MTYVVENIIKTKDAVQLEIIINEKISNLIKRDLPEMRNYAIISSTAQ